MYKKLLLVATFFIIVLLNSVVLADYPYSLKKGEEYVLILSFDGEMTYTLTRIANIEIEQDPTNLAVFSFRFFRISFPLDVTAKNFVAYNNETNEKLRCELIQSRSRLDDVINEIFESENFTLTEETKEEKFGKIYNELERGMSVFFVQIPIDQFKDSKVEVLFQFNINLDDFFIALGKGPIPLEEYYLYKNICRVNEFTEAESVDRITFVAPKDDEIWKAKRYRKLWIFRINKESPEKIGITEDNRRFVSWKVTNLDKINLDKINLDIGFGSPVERNFWENRETSIWYFILTYIGLFWQL